MYVSFKVNYLFCTVVITIFVITHIKLPGGLLGGSDCGVVGSMLSLLHRMAWVRLLPRQKKPGFYMVALPLQGDDKSASGIFV